MLTVISAFGGLLIGYAVLQFFGALALDDLPRGAEIRMDAVVVAYALLAAGFIGVIMGAIPVATALPADSDELRVTERYRRPSMNHLIVGIAVDDPKVLTKPWKSAHRRWTLGNGEVYEFYCTNNKELEELEKLRELELRGK